MADWLIIPDVHGRDFWRSAVFGHEEDPIVFLGDYLDPYPFEDVSAVDAYRALTDIITFKKEHPENVVLLLGNHDLGYLDSEICTCRRDYPRAYMIGQALLENLSLFDLVHADGKLLFSHAGIAEDWVERNRQIFGAGDFDPLQLNTMLHDAGARSQLFSALAQVSYYRGGSDAIGSPVWADVDEYLSGAPLLDGYFHLFGHSLHSGGPIDVNGQGFCLDCAQAFLFNTGESMKESALTAV